MVLLQPQPAKAEATVSYKYQDYRESGGRVGVQVNSALLETSLGTEAKLRLTGVVDSIAGATPTGEAPAAIGGAVPLTQMSDERTAWTVDLSRQFGRSNLTLGVARSRESDYVSTGYSLNTVTDFNAKNTELLAGVSFSDDTLRAFHRSDWVGKETLDLLVGFTQLLSPRTKVGVNLSWGRSTGFLSDPYKIISKQTELLPGISLPLTFRENRPAEREKRILFASANHTVAQLNGALEASYRLYHDSFGLTSHTLAAGWFQRLGSQVIVSPGLRCYQQSAADFYRVTLTGTAIAPSNQPNPAGPFYSADYRLARFRSITAGVKIVWTPHDRVRLEAAYDRYSMKGRDGVTSASAFPSADILTLGAAYSW